MAQRIALCLINDGSCQKDITDGCIYILIVTAVLGACAPVCFTVRMGFAIIACIRLKSV
jgi:hypothetical protein